ncbi:hypothetical protein [Sulfitobacter guttiformis]|nr:hypothetical protein [Sulfitobacter guttiformis]KIN71957.1 hypothetical protein Z949_1123 [Sulfitobacter guttiformis KCTC 32187]
MLLLIAGLLSSARLIAPDMRGHSKTVRALFVDDLPRVFAGY